MFCATIRHCASATADPISRKFDTRRIIIFASDFNYNYSSVLSKFMFWLSYWLNVNFQEVITD